MRGATVLELVLACLLFSFLIAATAKLYHTGEYSQGRARQYTDAQTRARDGMFRMVRTVRHGYAVETTGSTAFYSGPGTTVSPASGSSQIIVTVPQPNNTDGRDHVRFYVSGGTLYGQRSDDTGLGKALATGVQSLTCNYFQTATTSTGSATTAVDGTPGTATEVQFTLVATSGSITITRRAYVELRNATLGL